MALSDADLLVVQSQDDGQLYKLRIDALDRHLENSAGIQFRGSVDLNNGAAAQDPAVDLGAVSNGDLYLVESDAAVINADWVMDGGVTSASEQDRIIWQGEENSWLLVTGGSGGGGTIVDITATPPLRSDGDALNPVLTIDQATTTEPGAVARLATADDVKHTDGTGSSTAVVTADLLKDTNDAIQGIKADAGVTEVTYVNSDSNDAILITPTKGDVTLDVLNATESIYGVVKIATSSDIAAGTPGASAIIDAEKLQAATADFITEAIISVEAATDDLTAAALTITTNVDKEVTVQVNENVFAPYDFSSLDDING